MRRLISSPPNSGLRGRGVRNQTCTRSRARAPDLQGVRAQNEGGLPMQPRDPAACGYPRGAATQR
eukprot:4667959-Pyramimonas_sp.AAC.1